MLRPFIGRLMMYNCWDKYHDETFFVLRFYRPRFTSVFCSLYLKNKFIYFSLLFHFVDIFLIICILFRLTWKVEICLLVTRLTLWTHWEIHGFQNDAARWKKKLLLCLCICEASCPLCQYNKRPMGWMTRQSSPQLSKHSTHSPASLYRQMTI